MGWYDEHILPHIINAACSTRPTRKQRQKIVPHAEGEILEIGFGSGLNLAHYPDRVKEITTIDPKLRVASTSPESLSNDNMEP